MISRSTRPQPSSRPRPPAAWALVLFFLLGCPAAEQTPPTAGRGNDGHGATAPIEARSTQTPERRLDPVSLRNMSELLAGLAPQSSEAADEISPVWRQHMEESEAIWSRLAPRFEAMRRWRETVMTELPYPRAPVLSPFGDPDLVAALSLFPEAKSYLLVGLEAPGRLPLPEDFSAEIMEQDLRRLRTAFLSLADAGYFVRSKVQGGVRGGAFDGILPILLVSLVRGGRVPVALEYVGIDPGTREIQPLPPDAERARALRILFRPQGDEEGPISAVYYFSQDLSNGGLLTDEPFTYLLRRQNAMNVFLKAAEYRLHSSDYSLFRKLVLEEASALLQDDSGVPIRFLTSDRWKIHLYGRYHEVLAAYRAFRQDDLAAAFHKAEPATLGFPIGFNSDPDGGGLLLALRKSELTQPAGAPSIPSPEPQDTP